MFIGRIRFRVTECGVGVVHILGNGPSVGWDTEQSLFVGVSFGLVERMRDLHKEPSGENG